MHSLQALPLEHPELFSQFAFLIAGYREEHVGWEFCVVVRKLGLLIIAAAAPPSTHLGLRSFVSTAHSFIASARSFSPSCSSASFFMTCAREAREAAPREAVATTGWLQRSRRSRCKGLRELSRVFYIEERV